MEGREGEGDDDRAVVPVIGPHLDLLRSFSVSFRRVRSRKRLRLGWQRPTRKSRVRYTQTGPGSYLRVFQTRVERFTWSPVV